MDLVDPIWGKFSFIIQTRLEGLEMGTEVNLESLIKKKVLFISNQTQMRVFIKMCPFTLLLPCVH